MGHVLLARGFAWLLQMDTNPRGSTGSAVREKSPVVLRHFGHEEFSVIVLHCEVGLAPAPIVSRAGKSAEALRNDSGHYDIVVG